MTLEILETCSSCKFHLHGCCHAAGPLRENDGFEDDPGSCSTVWPETAKTDSCGMWEVRTHHDRAITGHSGDDRLILRLQQSAVPEKLYPPDNSALFVSVRAQPGMDPGEITSFEQVVIDGNLKIQRAGHHSERKLLISTIAGDFVFWPIETRTGSPAFGYGPERSKPQPALKMHAPNLGTLLQSASKHGDHLEMWFDADTEQYCCRIGGGGPVMKDKDVTSLGHMINREIAIKGPVPTQILAADLTVDAIRDRSTSVDDILILHDGDEAIQVMAGTLINGGAVCCEPKQLSPLLAEIDPCRAYLINLPDKAIVADVDQTTEQEFNRVLTDAGLSAEDVVRHMGMFRARRTHSH
ncbi:MAG: hypothetical protein HC841_00440 [Verrucomicrobiae bacterium]|nr:hypothetical protein [Verrucomicrobiae bacterium]